MSWLISKALMNSLCLQELAVESLEENFSDGEQFVQSSGNNTQQAYCAPDKMTGFSRLSRFGMTYKPLTETRGEELLTLFREGFHARTSAQQEKVQELTEKEAECGEKWRASFTKYNLDSCSWKTHQCSLLGDLDEFSETWPQWGLMRDGECWEQRTLEQTIRGIGFGLSPNGVDSFHTPNTTGLDGGSNSRKALKQRQEMWPTPCLPGNGGTNGKAKMKKMLANKWPTPTCHNSNEKGSPSEFKRDSPGLGTVVLWFPTPQASDNRDRGNMSNPSIQRRIKIGKQIMLSQSVDRNSGLLNPTWVEWLMGWPLEWTDLKPLEMDKSPCVLQQPGEF
jgi:DNA (cytosine-5)-methyltransferase 1